MFVSMCYVTIFCVVVGVRVFDSVWFAALSNSCNLLLQTITLASPLVVRPPPLNGQGRQTCNSRTHSTTTPVELGGGSAKLIESHPPQPLPNHGQLARRVEYFWNSVHRPAKSGQIRQLRGEILSQAWPTLVADAREVSPTRCGESFSINFEESVQRPGRPRVFIESLALPGLVELSSSISSLRRPLSPGILLDTIVDIQHFTIRRRLPITHAACSGLMKFTKA